MVPLGLIIIAIVLMALMVLGVPVSSGSCRCQGQPQARTGQRPDTGA